MKKNNYLNEALSYKAQYEEMNEAWFEIRKNLIGANKDLRNYKKLIEMIEDYCKQQNLKYDTTACEILQIIDTSMAKNN